MPYIKSELRGRFRPCFEEIPTNAGELNYAISTVLKDYIGANGLSYQVINDVVGALEGAKAEFQRRVVVPYEDLKIKENGDI